MKLSNLALATTLALAFAGCTLDSALNSVTSTIDSITTPSGTTNTSTDLKTEVKNFKTTKDVENFCNTAKRHTKYKITSLPTIVWDEFGTASYGEVNVLNAKKKITLKSSTPYFETRPPFEPNILKVERSERNKTPIRLIKPLMAEVVSNNPLDCTIEY
nr:hypothetical protein [uncultured Campylobacter sp.]